MEELSSQYALARETFLAVSSAFYAWRRSLDEAGFLIGLDNVPETEKRKAMARCQTANKAFLYTLSELN